MIDLGQNIFIQLFKQILILYIYNIPYATIPIKEGLTKSSKTEGIDGIVLHMIYVIMKCNFTTTCLVLSWNTWFLVKCIAL